jgi:hypothetical protein
MAPKDRLKDLESSTIVNGIDFVEIASADQKTLWVHFLNTVPLQGTLTDVEITGGETIPNVPVSNLEALKNHVNEASYWTTDSEGRPILTLLADAPGDFSSYTLTIASSILDLFFNRATFSFKALCPSDLDCETPPQVCPPPEGEMPPIDYLAKDFLSFRQALSDFSALRYPEWQERSEADFGMMFMEALCSLADDLSYTQDRISAEASLETATQRRSIVRHARLVDYEPQPALAAGVLLQLDVQSGVTAIPSGLVMSAQGPDGRPIDFETGYGLIDPQTGRRNQATFAVNSAWNRGTCPNYNILPYIWDNGQQCLRAGSTELWVIGQGFQFVTDESAGPGGGMALLIDTAADNTADPHIREIVHLVSAHLETDTLYNQALTHLIWRPEEALKYDHNLTVASDGCPGTALAGPRTALAGNLVPATQGRQFTESFAIPPAADLQTPLAIVRTGPNNTPDEPAIQYLYTLQHGRMAWLAQGGLDTLPLPEIVLTGDWRWRRRLLDAQPFEAAFTVDPARFTRIARNSWDDSVLQDYADDNGDTIRFGDGIFGAVPDPGTVFQVTYSVGGGAIGNVAADSIVKVDPAAASLVRSVTNPFPAEGGADEETDERVRRLAPQAFRAQQFRAVRPEDYEEAARRLPWILRAGTVFRWTGSWLTVFTTADPKGTEVLPVDEHIELIDLLNRYRLAGYESYAPAPHYVSLDLIITVCAQPDAFRGDVEAAVLRALSVAKFPDGTTGFFYFDNFTFGTPLERSALEAAIQDSYGVSGVVSIQYRQRGIIPVYVEMPETVQVSSRDILRLDNDPSRPERGSIKVHVEGGK